MRVPWTRARARHIGLALSPNLFVAFFSRPRIGSRGPAAPEIWIRPLTPSLTSETWTNLAEVLGELGYVVGGGTLHVALLPPLASYRRLDLAGVNEADATRVVQRDPSRFLPLHGRTETLVELEGSGWRRRSAFRLVAATTSVVEALGTAAAATGWSLGAVLPASLAWGTTGKRLRSHEYVACLGTHIEVVRAQNGAPTMLRRLPRPAGELTAQQVRAILVDRGIAVQPNATIMLSDEEAMALAAECAVSAAGPTVLPERERVAVRQRQRRASRWAFVAAALLLVLTGALALWDVQREREAVAAERMSIRPSVVEALAMRESLSVVSERLAAIRLLESRSPHWSTWLATLAETLPSDAFLFSLSAEGDSLRLEGATTRAAPVFDALSAVLGVRRVRPEGQIRQEVRGGNATSEHFILSAFLEPEAGSNAAANRFAAPNAAPREAPGSAP